MAIILDGATQYAHVNNSFGANGTSAPATLAFFMKPNSVAATGYPVAVNDDTSWYFHTARVEPGPQVAGRMKTATSVLTAYSSVTDAQWVPVIVTNDGAGLISSYVGSTTPVTASGSVTTLAWDIMTIGAALQTGTTVGDFFKGKVAYAMYFERLWNSTEISAFINATAVADINTISTTGRVARYDLISDGNADGSGAGLTLVGTPTFDSDDPLSAAATPTISSIDTDNAVNQYQQNAVIALSNFTETITSVTLNGVACPIIEADPADNQIAVDIPGTLATGSYDLVVSGATETATLSAVSYTQTHEYTAPYEMVDSNSLFANQALTENSYFTIVSGPTSGTLDAAGAESGNLWGNDISDIYTPDGGFSGDDNVTLEALYSDSTTDQWTATISVQSTSLTVSSSGEAVVASGPFSSNIKPSIPVRWRYGGRHPLTSARVRMFSPFDPAWLFAGGEQGAWYEPSDLSTLYQDAVGTTPVTADGDSVGLMLDKSQGLVLGPEELTEANAIEQDVNSTVGWTAAALDVFVSQSAITDGTDYAFETGSNSTAQAAARIYREIAGLSVGSFYKISFSARHVGVGGKWGVFADELNSGSDQGIAVFANTDTTFESIEGYFQATASTMYIVVREASPENTGGLYLDSMSIAEAVGNHATQSTAASKRLYRTDGTLHWLEDDLFDDAITAHLPDLGTNATLAYADGAGVTILTGQTISGDTSLPTVAQTYGVFYLDRPFNPDEEEAVTKYLNQLRGA